MLAWLRAILLQLAHPLIAAGVARHSTFRGSTASAFSRLHHTIDAMLAVTFGTEHERGAALDAIRAIHRRVNGTLEAPSGPFAAGTTYSAEDPALLLWVHATLVESMVLLHDSLVEPLDEADRDRYCVESSAVAVELGAAARDVPRTWRELEAYLTTQYSSGRIVVGPQARALVSSLLAPGMLGLLVAPVLELVAAGQLPADVREQYRLPWSATRQRFFRAAMKALRALRRGSPARVTAWKQSRSIHVAIDESDTRNHQTLRMP